MGTEFTIDQSFILNVSVTSPEVGKFSKYSGKNRFTNLVNIGLCPTINRLLIFVSTDSTTSNTVEESVSYNRSSIRTLLRGTFNKRAIISAV